MSRDYSKALPALTNLFEGVIAYLDPDALREGLEDTPRRAAAAFLDYTSGHVVDTKSLLKHFDGGNGQTVIRVDNVPFYSMCEHHLAPFFGTASIEYKPIGERVVGLSKLARLLEAHARRLQVQERICYDIARDIQDVLNPDWVKVELTATHMCMCSRGARAHGATTTTTTTLYHKD